MRTKILSVMIGSLLLGGIAKTNAQAGTPFNVALGSTGSYNLRTATGIYNTAVGDYSLSSGDTATPNGTFSGAYNSAFGGFSLLLTTSGYQNCAFGYRALAKNTIGFNNIAVGYDASRENDSGGENVAVGYQALLSSTAGNGNTAIGTRAGFYTQGTGNVFLGNYAGYNETGSSKLYIDNGAYTHALIYGNFSSRDLELNADGLNSRVLIRSGNTGTSGLRFANLDNTTNAITNPTGKVLTVDSSGDVILVNDKGLISNGLNTTVSGSGVSGSPYQITAKNIYTHDGILDTTTIPSGITGVRTVGMENNNLFFDTHNSTSGNGRIYIGNTTFFPAITATSNFRLLVEGGILAERVKVALRSGADWKDSVFEKEYELMPLSEVDAFVKENKHLPGIDSATDLVKNGLDLGEMQSKQMSKIEELTLYVIEQNKTLEKQSKEIEELKALVNSLLEKK